MLDANTIETTMALLLRGSEVYIGPKDK